MSIPVILSADIEFSINGALASPATATPLGLECVYRRRDGQDQGLGFILSTLAKHGLPGTFFLETLCARFFGPEPVAELAQRILAAGSNEVELHLHPEWRYFNGPGWREELTARLATGWTAHGMIAKLPSEELDGLVGEASRWFAEAMGRPPRAFRSGSLSVAAGLYPVLAKHGIGLSSSIGLACQPPAEPELHLSHGVGEQAGVREIPVTSFCDWQLGSRRHLRLFTIIGSSLRQMRALLEAAAERGEGPIVMLTHAAEFSTPAAGGYRPNPITMERFEGLCGFLASNRERFDTTTLARCADAPLARFPAPLPTPAWQELGRWLDIKRM